MDDRLSHKNGNLFVLVGPGEPGAAPSLTLRISDDHARELTDLLTSKSIKYSTIVEMSAAEELAPYLVYIGGGLTGLATVLRTIFHGNDGKRFKIKTKDGAEYSGQGLSTDDIIRLLEAARDDDTSGNF